MDTFCCLGCQIWSKFGQIGIKWKTIKLIKLQIINKQSVFSTIWLGEPNVLKYNLEISDMYPMPCQSDLTQNDWPKSDFPDNTGYSSTPLILNLVDSMTSSYELLSGHWLLWELLFSSNQAWLILRAHRARALGPRPLGGPQKWEKMGKNVGRDHKWLVGPHGRGPVLWGLRTARYDTVQCLQPANPVLTVSDKSHTSLFCWIK